MNEFSPALSQEIARQRQRDITRVASRAPRVVTPTRHRFGRGRRPVTDGLGD